MLVFRFVLWSVEPCGSLVTLDWCPFSKFSAGIVHIASHEERRSDSIWLMASLLPFS
jgi:hypothetical protein